MAKKRNRDSVPAVSKQETLIQKAEMYQGPLPLPNHFREYEEILEGSAERLLAMVERQSAHRQLIEKVTIRGDSARAWVGVFVGGFLALCCVVGGIALVFHGQAAAGATIATASVVGLAGVFVYGTHSRRAERESRAPTGRRTRDSR